MAEFGIVAARRELGMKELLAIISDIDDARLPSMARELLVLQVEHLGRSRGGSLTSTEPVGRLVTTRPPGG